MIPAYNEEDSIAEVIEQAMDAVPNADILVINDGSIDRTGDIARKKEVMLLNLPNNLGNSGAKQSGYKYSLKYNYKYIVQIDADGQHNPNEVQDLLIPLQEGRADIVIGSRFINNEGFTSTPLRRLGIRFFSFLIKLLTGTKISDPTSGFRACNSVAARHFAYHYPTDNYSDVETIIDAIKNCMLICEVPVVMKDRYAGTSSISQNKAIYYMIEVSLAVLFSYIKKPKGSTRGGRMNL
jgi:glycosyltransferase involved in cell wall biosynthesis